MCHCDGKEKNLFILCCQKIGAVLTAMIALRFPQLPIYRESKKENR